MLNKAKLVAHQEDMASAEGPTRLDRFPLITRSARGRFSANTDVYVLPPFSFYLDLDYHGTFPRVGKSDHLFTQELELGLPYRFQLAFELDEEHQNGRSQIPFTRIEGRWAPANWGKLPLNPTLLVEYDIGTGKQYPVQPGQNAEQEGGGDPIGDVVRQQASIPNSYELRLLLGQEIGTYIEFASNIFFDQDLWANREREIGFSTASSLAIRGEALKVGLETSYQNVSQPGARSKAQNIFRVGVTSLSRQPRTGCSTFFLPLARIVKL